MKKTTLSLSLLAFFCSTGIINAKSNNLTKLPPGIVKIESDCENKKNANQSVEKLFDSNINTKWFADGGPDNGYPCHITWEYESKKKVTSYTLTSGNDAPGRDPKSWKLYGSNGTNYILIDQQSDITFEQRKEAKKFAIKNAGEYKSFKFEILSVAANDAKTPPQLTGLDLDYGQQKNTVAITKRPITVANSNIETIETDCDNKKNANQSVDKLFDGNINTKWFADGGPDKGYPCYIAWDYKSERNIKSYTLISGNDAPGRDPKSWKLYGYDGKKYVLIDKQSEVVFDGRKEAKKFTLKTSGNYKSFKFEILSVASDNTNTPPQLTGIELE